MKTLISPEAHALLHQPLTRDADHHVVSETIRHALDRLRENQYFFCTRMGASSAISTFDGTPLALYYKHAEKLAVLFCAPDSLQSMDKAFFERLIPRCRDFHIF